MLQVIHLPLARLDLVKQFQYFDEHAGLEVAERFTDAVDATCRQLLVHPRSGLQCDFRNQRLRGLRRFPVKGFENYLIFYSPRPHGLDVIRVLHGARDLEEVFTKD